MKKVTRKNKEMLPHYDFSKGVKGKYARKYSSGTNLVKLSPDVAKAFPTSSSVNEALRKLVRRARKHR